MTKNGPIWGESAKQASNNLRAPRGAGKPLPSAGPNLLRILPLLPAAQDGPVPMEVGSSAAV